MLRGPPKATREFRARRAHHRHPDARAPRCGGSVRWTAGAPLMSDTVGWRGMSCSPTQYIWLAAVWRCPHRSAGGCRGRRDAPRGPAVRASSCLAERSCGKATDWSTRSTPTPSRWPRRARVPVMVLRGATCGEAVRPASSESPLEPDDLAGSPRPGSTRYWSTHRGLMLLEPPPNTQVQHLSRTTTSPGGATCPSSCVHHAAEAVHVDDGLVVSFMQSIYHDLVRVWFPRAPGSCCRTADRSFPSTPTTPMGWRNRASKRSTRCVPRPVEDGSPYAAIGTMGAEGQPQTKVVMLSPSSTSAMTCSRPSKPRAG